MSATASSSGCPECEGSLRASGTETVCVDCGLVVADDPIDRGPEWRAFPEDEGECERTGAPLTRSRHDRGLTTEIGTDAETFRLKGRKRRRVSRLRRQHKRSQIRSKAERNRVYGFTEIRAVVTRLDLPTHVRDSACRLFESAQGEDLLRGRSIEGFAAAAVYATCRAVGLARTIGEVVADARATRAELTAAYDAMNRDLGLPVGPIDPREYVPRFASALEVPSAVERRASELVGVAFEEGLVAGRNPGGVAAACLYRAAREADGVSLTQAEAADAADVAPVTLRHTSRELPE